MNRYLWWFIPVLLIIGAALCFFHKSTPSLSSQKLPSGVRLGWSDSPRPILLFTIVPGHTYTLQAGGVEYSNITTMEELNQALSMVHEVDSIALVCND